MFENAIIIRLSLPIEMSIAAESLGETVAVAAYFRIG